MKILYSAWISVFIVQTSWAQLSGDNTPYIATMEDVIILAKSQSVDACQARHQFLTAYWQYRSAKARLLPSMNMSLTLPNFNHSLNSVQSFVTGEYSYVQSYNMRTGAMLTIDQNIAATGAKLSLSSSLERMDQFRPKKSVSFINQPVAFTITQPLFGTFNALKWNKKVDFLDYQKAKLEYQEAMQEVILKTVVLFFETALVQRKFQIAGLNYTNSKEQYRIAQEKFRLGALSEEDLLQLELAVRNDQLKLNKAKFDAREAFISFNNFLGLAPGYECQLALPPTLPDLNLEPTIVYDYALKNSSHLPRIELNRINADLAVKQAKKERGISADLYIRVGLNQTADNWADSYHSPPDQESVSLGIRIPLLDWGIKKGRISVAESRFLLTQSESNQECEKFRQDIYLKTIEFQHQKEQCEISIQADSIARRFYALASEKFKNGQINVLTLTSAQIEKDQAQIRRIMEIQNYWKLYYTIEKLTLYNFIRGEYIAGNPDFLPEP